MSDARIELARILMRQVVAEVIADRATQRAKLPPQPPVQDPHARRPLRPVQLRSATADID